uniref:Uncharacterized protein n=1 Tax=Megaselia scalaris TaxID=36166 RepID=T1GWP4_MEGSC
MFYYQFLNGSSLELVEFKKDENDIEGAFNNVSTTAITSALQSIGVSTPMNALRTRLDKQLWSGYPDKTELLKKETNQKQIMIN